MIGQVLAPFGIKGEVRVRAETDFPERFTWLDEVCLQLPTGEERRVRVVRARPTPKGILVQFAGYEDRSRAEELRGARIKIQPSMAVPLPEGTYYVHDILGLRVVTPDGRELGRITEVIRAPANDVYVCGERMIPAVRQFVKEVNLELGLMVVDLPPEEDEAHED